MMDPDSREAGVLACKCLSLAVAIIIFFVALEHVLTGTSKNFYLISFSIYNLVLGISLCWLTDKKPPWKDDEDNHETTRKEKEEDDDYNKMIVTNV